MTINVHGIYSLFIQRHQGEYLELVKVQGLEGTIPKTVLGAVFDSFCKLKVFQTTSKQLVNAVKAISFRSWPLFVV